MMSGADMLEVMLRLTMAVLFGGALGWEREEQQKPAGLRTHMLVALGASSAIIATLYMIETEHLKGDSVRFDPIRVVEGVIGGIGFLGAGSIIQSRGSVEGITTAASIWVAGALGIAAGLGFHFLALMTVIFALFILRLIGMIERKYYPKDKDKNPSPY